MRVLGMIALKVSPFGDRYVVVGGYVGYWWLCCVDGRNRFSGRERMSGRDALSS